MKKLILLLSLVVIFIAQSCDKDNNVEPEKSFVGEWIYKEGSPEIPREYDYRLVVAHSPVRVSFFHQRYGIPDEVLNSESYVENNILYWSTNYRQGQCYFKSGSNNLFVKWKLNTSSNWGNESQFIKK